MEWFTETLAIVGTSAAILFGYIAFVRNRDSDKASEVKNDATIMVELGYIKSGVDDVKTEQREQRNINTGFLERLSAVEASAKQAHKRIDHIEGYSRPE